jgi:hypothetical protein
MFKYNYVPADKLEDKPANMPLRDGKAKFIVKAFYDMDKSGQPLKTLEGTPKINLLLAITDFQNSKGTIYDTITANMPWKIKQLSEAVGMPGIYNESGQIDFGKMVGYEGECLIKTQESDKYGARSIVDKYLPHPASNQDSTHGPSVDDDSFLDDDIPF